jgi:hypothetical protein
VNVGIAALSAQSTAATVCAALGDFDCLALGWKRSLVVTTVLQVHAPEACWDVQGRRLVIAVDPEAHAIVAVFADRTLFSKQCGIDRYHHLRDAANPLTLNRQFLLG